MGMCGHACIHSHGHMHLPVWIQSRPSLPDKPLEQFQVNSFQVARSLEDDWRKPFVNEARDEAAHVETTRSCPPKQELAAEQLIAALGDSQAGFLVVQTSKSQVSHTASGEAR